MIKQAFLAQVAQISAPSIADALWLPIETAYTEPDRFFHDLSHLEHLLAELMPLQNEFRDWDTVLFSIVYHDIVYNVAQDSVASDNEERSAAFAEQQLKQINYPPEKIERCKAQIMATQRHRESANNDTNLFTDADLSILGQPWTVYNTYRNNIRNEFIVYPDSIYNAGRRKALTKFLQMEPLFKTSHFRQLYESKAKENMQKEIQLLKA